MPACPCDFRSCTRPHATWWRFSECNFSQAPPPSLVRCPRSGAAWPPRVPPVWPASRHGSPTPPRTPPQVVLELEEVVAAEHGMPEFVNDVEAVRAGEDGIP
jgi:hypothetical protein